MKLLYLLLFTTACFGQISITKEIKTETKVVVYDSTYNFPKSEVESIIGQDLYLLPLHEDLKKYGYSGFTIYPKKFSQAYKGTSSRSNTPVEMIEGKMFEVNDVFDHDIYSSKKYLELVEKESKDTLYYEYSTDLSYNFKFIINGYLEKLKERVSDSIYLSAYAQPKTNLKNGSEYKIKPEDETVWTITDVTLYGDHYLLSFIIENEKGIQLNLPVADENKWFYSSEKVDEYKQLYGGFYKNILKKTVKIGMPKEALEIAWGKPDKINRSSYGSDQWVYNGQYVYIENGKVKSWN